MVWARKSGMSGFQISKNYYFIQNSIVMCAHGSNKRDQQKRARITSLEVRVENIIVAFLSMF